MRKSKRTTRRSLGKRTTTVTDTYVTSSSAGIVWTTVQITADPDHIEDVARTIKEALDGKATRLQ